MVKSLEIFKPEEAIEIGKRLESLRTNWIQRGDGFFTYGVATYLDVMNSKQPEEDYYKRLIVYNKEIWKNFGDVMERVRQELEKFFNCNTIFEPSVAMPGFHIFENNGLTIYEQPSQHFDLQHRCLRWPFEILSEEIISFTLAIKLPNLGGGLDYWDFDENDWKRLERMGRIVDLKTLTYTKPMIRHEYVIGHAAIQLRPILHRIAAIASKFENDQRITLQGHGVKNKDNEWVLYW